MLRKYKKHLHLHIWSKRYCFLSKQRGAGDTGVPSRCSCHSVLSTIIFSNRSQYSTVGAFIVTFAILMIQQNLFFPPSFPLYMKKLYILAPFQILRQTSPLPGGTFKEWNTRRVYQQEKPHRPFFTVYKPRNLSEVDRRENRFTLNIQRVMLGISSLFLHNVLQAQRGKGANGGIHIRHNVWTTTLLVRSGNPGLEKTSPDGMPGLQEYMVMLQLPMLNGNTNTSVGKKQSSL